MELNRKELYLKAKKMLKENKHRFICTALREILKNEYNIDFSLKTIQDNFPELKKRMPISIISKNEDIYLRINVLNECIKEC